MVAFQFAKDHLRGMEDDHLAKQMWEDFLKQGAQCNMVQKVFADQGSVAPLSGKLWRGYADKESFIMVTPVECDPPAEDAVPMPSFITLKRRADEDAEPPGLALKRRIVDLDQIDDCAGKVQVQV